MIHYGFYLRSIYLLFIFVHEIWLLHPPPRPVLHACNACSCQKRASVTQGLPFEMLMNFRVLAGNRTACMCTTRCLESSGEDTGSPGTGVLDGCELYCLRLLKDPPKQLGLILHLIHLDEEEIWSHNRYLYEITQLLRDKSQVSWRLLHCPFKRQYM